MWEKLDNYPNYEINERGDVRNTTTKKILKVSNMCITDRILVLGTCNVTNNGTLKHVLKIFMQVTFEDDEII